jgi:hypothetical protein
MYGTLTTKATSGQYKKYEYRYGTERATGIHVFTTKSGQSIAPAIYTKRTPLSQMNPTRPEAQDVIAKTNGCMFVRDDTRFLGFFYQGPNKPMYINGVAFTTAPNSSNMYSDVKFWPSFCIKKDGSATIRWFSSKDDLNMALPYCDYVIGACHPLVYDSKCVFNEYVRGPDALGGQMLYDIANPDSRGSRFNTEIDMSTAHRTLLGHKSNGAFVMVATDGDMSVETAANMMQELGCDFAVNMDGGSCSEMRIASGYGPAGRVTIQGGTLLNTAVCAYVK